MYFQLIYFAVNSSVDDLKDILKDIWSTFYPHQQNSMDLCRIAAMGHSFGGATAIEVMCKEVKFKYV